MPQPIAGYTVAPVWDENEPHYVIFLEETDTTNDRVLSQFARGLERELCNQNIEYAAKRESARLGTLRVAIIPTGTWQKWDRARLSQTGGAAEQYKRPCLMGDTSFYASMPVMHERRYDES